VRGDGAQDEDDIGSYGVQFGDEPGATGHNVAASGRLVQPAFTVTGRFPSEVLDRVRQVQLIACDPSLLERAVEQMPRRADEGFAFAVLHVAGLLTDDEHARSRRASAEHNLGCPLMQVAAAT
jgi:hypothetical protein